MNKRIFWLTAAGLASALAACGTPKPMDINEERGLGPNNSVILGSASRSINTVEIKEREKAGQVIPKRVVCAEPSPDVATTLAQSITASFQAAGQMKDGKGQEAAIQAAGQFGRSSVQGAVQLGERFATIQLLRDSLHRACEAYSNGALSDMSYSLILSRYHATMVTLLNSELSAGAFGRGLGGLSGSASHSQGGTAEEVTDATTRRNAAFTALTQAKATEQAAVAAAVAAPGDAAKAGVATTASQSTARAQTDLMAAEQALARAKAASGSAQITAHTVQGIQANVTPQVADKLIAMTKQFNESGAVEAMLVACVTAMDRGQAADARQSQGFQGVCSSFFQNLGDGFKGVTDAKIAILKDDKLEKLRLEQEFSLRLEQIRAGIVGDISRLCAEGDAEKRKACIENVHKVAVPGQRASLPEAFDMATFISQAPVPLAPVRAPAAHPRPAAGSINAMPLPSLPRQP